MALVVVFALQLFNLASSTPFLFGNYRVHNPFLVFFLRERSMKLFRNDLLGAAAK
jgi:hypothetical protein